jgi:pimeloyl-ACP methyl ester carboxylesterase
VARPALTAFTEGMGAAPEDVEWLVEESMRVPAAARAGMFGRDVDNAATLAAIDVPTLVVHGRRDAVVDPSAGEYAASRIPGATLTWFAGGHLPFLAEPDRFATTVARHFEHVGQEA